MGLSIECATIRSKIVEYMDFYEIGVGELIRQIKRARGAEVDVTEAGIRAMLANSDEMSSATWSELRYFMKDAKLEKAKAVTAFDIDERERIRQILLDYMKANIVGVPKLAQRMTATLRGRPEIVVRSLARFLRGEIRSNDALVGHCAAFVATLKGYGSSEDDLDIALRNFYGVKPDGGFSGSFENSTPQAGNLEQPISIITVSQHGDKLRIKERYQSEGKVVNFEGVLLKFGKMYMATMKDAVFLKPRNIHLEFFRHSNEFRGQGSGIHPMTGLCQYFSVDMKKIYDA